jgi:hypothetical protein
MGLGYRQKTDGGCMKKNLALLALVVLFALMASFGFAVSGATMHITVPFDFYAGTELMPAGEYTFEMTSSTGQTGSLVTILTREGLGICMLGARPGTHAAASQLMFNKYENKYFLSSVSIQGFKAEVKMQNLEKEVRAQLQKQRDTVTIAQK